MTGFVAHLDADCFYVSAERVRHPDLAGKPVGVLGNNGACVIAKSYEMKARGVKTGTPIWDAKALCPEGVYVKRDFYWYEVLSRKMLDVVTSAVHSQLPPALAPGRGSVMLWSGRAGDDRGEVAGTTRPALAAFDRHDWLSQRAGRQRPPAPTVRVRLLPPSVGPAASGRGPEECGTGRSLR
jgi:hypothetical protein